MRKKEKLIVLEVEQFWIHEEQPSSTLMVLFPGMGYTCDKPLLHYAQKKAMDLSMDVLCIQYGIQEFHKDRVNEALDPAKQIAEACLKEVQKLADYSQFYFISKSLGTVAAGYVGKLLKQPVHQFYLTPLAQTIPYMKNSDDYTAIGTKDPMITEEDIECIRLGVLHTCIYEDANHSLEIDGDTVGSVKILLDVVKSYDEFLR